MTLPVPMVVATALVRQLAPGKLLGKVEWGDPPQLWLDSDCCTLEGRPLRQPEDWLANIDRLEQVRGAFVLAHWNGRRLLLARDAIGERSLYYCLEPLAFASSLKQLPHGGRLDPLALGLYLCCAYIPGWRTLIQGVRELLPGQVLEIDALPFDQEKVRERWLWTPPQVPFEEDELVLQGRLREALELAVARRLQPGPLGCSLSGGIDSSLVVALAARQQPLHTYSISFGPDYPNELAHSSLVAQHCRSLHRILELSPAQVLERLDNVLGWLNKPNGDPLTIPNAMIFETAAQEVPVLLNGEGGDPCFGGPKNVPMLLAELYGEGNRAASFLRSHLKCYDDLEQMLPPDFLQTRALEQLLEDDLYAPGSSLIQKLMAVNLRYKGGHHILPKVETISSPYGIQARSPLFDRDLVDFACRIPAQLKLKGSVEKYLLKQAVRDLLPSSIIDRPKSGMMVPVEAWFSGPLLPEARSRLLSGLGRRGIISAEYLQRLLDAKLGGLRPRRGVKIWLLLTLECWLQAHGL